MSRAVWLLGLAGCVIEVHAGNGTLATEDRDVGSFDGIRATLSIPVDVTAGPERTVKVTCDENLVPYIVTEVEDGDLVVRTASAGHVYVGIEPTVDCRVEITTPGATHVACTGSGPLTVTGEELGGLAEIVATGSGDVTVDGTAIADRVKVTDAGSGGVSVAGIEAGTVELVATGSGPIDVLAGAANGLVLTISGSGGVDAGGLVAGDVRATLTGSGGGEVTATSSVDALLTGSGDLVVHGDPDERDVTETGSGHVSFE